MKTLSRLIVFLLFTTLAITARSATRYWVAAATGNWNNTANWSGSSGGAGGASLPGPADAVYFNNLGPGNCNVNSIVGIASISVAAGYSGTISQAASTINITGTAGFLGGNFAGGTGNITIAGLFTLNGTLFTSTSGVLEFNNNAVFTSPTFTPNNGTVRFNGTGVSSPSLSGASSPAFYKLEFVGLAKTYTVSSTGNIAVNNLLSITGTGYCLLNTGIFDITGDLTVTNTATGGGGTATINLNGTGIQNYAGASSAGAGVLPLLNINNVGGAINLSGFPGVANSFNYTAGTINAGSSTFCVVRGSASTFSVNCSTPLNNIAIIAASATLTLTITGTLTATGDLALGGASNITLNTGNINVGGDLALSNTATGGGGTAAIIFNGSGSQVITSTGIAGQSRLPDIIINKTSGILTLPSLLTVIGDWTYQSGGLDATTNNSTVVFSNTLSITGTHTLNNVTFEATTNHTFTIASGTVLSVSGSLTTTGTASLTLNTAATAGTTAVQLQGDLLVSNTGTGGGNAGMILNGTGAQALTSTSAAGQGRLPYITIQKTSGAVTLHGIISESRNWNYVSGLVDATSFSPTVVFGWNNLTIASTGMSFNHVIFTSATATLSNSMTVQGDLTINGTGVLAPLGNTINLSGNWLNRATAGFTEATSTVNFTGSTLQTIGTTGSENFANLSLNNSAGIQLLNSIVVGLTLTMTTGMIDLNTNNATLGTAATAPGTLNYISGSIVNTGSFIRWFRSGIAIPSGGAAGFFPLGSATDMRSFYVAAPLAPTTGGTISVSYLNTSGTAAVTFSDGVSVVLIRKNLNWTVATGNGLTGGNYNLQIQGTNYGTITNVGDLRITLINSVVGTAGMNGGSTSNPQVNRTGLPATGLNNTFYLGTISNSGSPLPVKLLFFRAQLQESEVKLDWETAMEQNNFSFTIQRSADGGSWKNMLEVVARPESSAGNDYTAWDRDPIPGTSFYRLLQTDIDGRQFYSSVITINVSNPRRVTVFPNPASDFLIADLNSGEQVSVLLFGSNGRQFHPHLEKQAGKLKLSLASFPAGIYYLQFKFPDSTETRKIMVVH